MEPFWSYINTNNPPLSPAEGTHQVQLMCVMTNSSRRCAKLHCELCVAGVGEGSRGTQWHPKSSERCQQHPVPTPRTVPGLLGWHTATRVGQGRFGSVGGAHTHRGLCVYTSLYIDLHVGVEPMFKPSYIYTQPSSDEVIFPYRRDWVCDANIHRQDPLSPQI